LGIKKKMWTHRFFAVGRISFAAVALRKDIFSDISNVSFRGQPIVVDANGTSISTRVSGLHDVSGISGQPPTTIQSQRNATQKVAEWC
jgi:hypothetical protein